MRQIIKGYFYIVIVLYIFSIMGCECQNKFEKEYYNDGSLKSLTKRDCNNDLIKYERITFDSILQFKLLYDKSLPDTIIGVPWIHSIHKDKNNNNKINYYQGDTIVIYIDVASPPLLRKQIFWEHEGRRIELTANDKYKKYLSTVDDSVLKISKIANDSIEKFGYECIYFYGDQKWVTFTRKEKIHVEKNDI